MSNLQGILLSVQQSFYDTRLPHPSKVALEFGEIIIGCLCRFPRFARIEACLLATWPSKQGLWS